MIKPRKLNGTLVGLVGAGAILGVWAIRELIPKEKPSAKSISAASPVIAGPAIPPVERTLVVSRDPPAMPDREIIAQETAQSLLARITAALGSQDSADWDRVLNELYPALLAADRPAAIRLIETLAPGEKRVLLLRRLARAWGESDFAGAVDWISNLAEFSEQKVAFDEACLAAAERNPAEAIHAWERFDFKEDDHVLENLVQNWARLDLAAAQEWVRARPPSLQRDQAVARVAYVLAQTKPIDATALVLRELAAGPAQTEAVISILHQWAKSDPAGAAAWVAQFPSGALADRAKQELAGLRR